MDDDATGGEGASGAASVVEWDGANGYSTNTGLT